MLALTDTQRPPQVASLSEIPSLSWELPPDTDPPSLHTKRTTSWEESPSIQPPASGPGQSVAASLVAWRRGAQEVHGTLKGKTCIRIYMHMYMYTHDWSCSACHYMCTCTCTHMIGAAVHATTCAHVHVHT